ncbi:MAG: flagellar basal body rod protein FlgC [Armatimonadetes bacterium]|nr:flagellar basal body rod protein FlgC [Armatimonadota bacterium]MDW8027479.1 flagellar basal body rod protein FlgC [Armatimonadota bacterium]
MSVFKGFEISSSAMTAHRLWQEIAAVNIANAETTRTPTGEPFRRKLVVLMQDIQGVRVAAILDDPSPFRLVYDPSHPDADFNGYVRMPNVHPVLEMVDLMAATRGYEFSAQAFAIQRQMFQQALDLLR